MTKPILHFRELCIFFVLPSHTTHYISKNLMYYNYQLLHNTADLFLILHLWNSRERKSTSHPHVPPPYNINSPLFMPTFSWAKKWYYRYQKNKQTQCQLHLIYACTHTITSFKEIKLLLNKVLGVDLQPVCFNVVRAIIIVVMF